ncbi:hypothetical protein L1049_023634 [Liquidambar formosana]|uniref:Amidase domain-containing protein n=1 Tax=Liquidambar formosana TaxID=63359 RepID=A0AAP0RYI2_LIQFO
MLSTVQTPRFLLPCRFPLHFPPKPRHLHTSKPLFSSQPVSQHTLTDQSQPQPQTVTQSSPSPPQSQILTIRNSLLSRNLTAVELAESYLTRLKLTEPQIHSFLHISESVLREAEDIDRKIERSEEVGIMAGVLVGVKDNICTADMPSTAGSRILEGYRPAFDATAVRRVRDCGGFLLED